ncbi:MAG: hypothetical protein IJN51_04595 [Alistipes sp.]|nr:hypothetical protein [Alistipes sp.]MBQ6940563.1 hypothetical protein [Alistipes sp.]
MKRIYTLLTIIALGFASCQEELAPTFEGFEVDNSQIEAAAHGGKYQITVRSEDEWSVQSPEPWIMLSPANGRGEVECTIHIDSTLTHHERKAEIRFMSAGNILNKVDVTQKGFEPSIDPQNSSVAIDAYKKRDERWVEVEIKSNVEFTASTDAQWLSVNDHTLTLDRGARPRTTRLRLDWKMNSDPQAREAIITLRPDSLGESTTIVVRQQAGPLIEDNRAGDSLAVVTIYNKMECWAEDVISDKRPMTQWECMRLWQASDESLPCPEAVGRVRDLDLSYFNTDDDIPVEIKHLKYLETLSLFGNVNTMLKDINLCPEIASLNYLKALRIGAMGLVSLPDNFAELGDTLEELDLNSNNFNTIPKVINRENFPHLKSLIFIANRRSTVSDLRSASGMGLQLESDALRRLFLWEELEELALSYNYIEGSLPNFSVGRDGVRAYTAEDVKELGDTLNYAVANQLPRILPNMRSLRLNLNFFTGKLPDWLLYHPHLMEWGAETLVYQQQEKGIDSDGNAVGFENVPTSSEYYFEAYPLLRNRYEYNDTIGE